VYNFGIIIINVANNNIICTTRVAALLFAVCLYIILQLTNSHERRKPEADMKLIV
jgi:hypothetical protein